MPERKGAEIIVDHLTQQGVPWLFGLCGHGDVGLMDAALQQQDRIKTLSVHNEQVAGFMADAYYRVSGQPVATFTSCGPGSVSIQAAIACAMADSSAVFAITGNVPTQQFNKGPFQELGYHYQADFVSAMRPYVKRSFQATRADMLPDMMRHAYSHMLSGRTGPVHLDVPFNVFVEKTEERASVSDGWRAGVAYECQGSPDAIEAALDILLSGRRRLILAGHGCLIGRASMELTELAELLQIPVATTPQGKGAIDDRHPLSLGPTGRDGVYPANRAARACDVLLALGTRFGDRSTSSWADGITHSIPPTQLIHVDIDGGQLGRNYAPTVGITGSVRLVLSQLIAAAKKRLVANQSFGDNNNWLSQTAHWKHLWDSALAETKDVDGQPIHPDRLIAELQRAAPERTLLLSDIGAHHSWVVQQWRIREPRSLLQSGGFASMGFGICGALGAQLAAPDRPVLAVVGDGGFLMHASAVATAVEYELPVVWLVWNNCGYVSIRDLQVGFLGREFASRFRNARTGELITTDFAMLARSMGAEGRRVEHPDEIGDHLRAAFESRKPTVLDVRVQADVKRRTAGGWAMPPLGVSGPNFDPDPWRKED
ncbi:MAG: thiamine pyrophosphate-binding protein [Hyphomicrobiaceae bacterium]|nr:thiamine pyrophosphate-binding protein [Hyphomicrobiaceae bacterium]